MGYRCGGRESPGTLVRPFSKKCIQQAVIYTRCLSQLLRESLCMPDYRFRGTMVPFCTLGSNVTRNGVQNKCHDKGLHHCTCTLSHLSCFSHFTSMINQPSTLYVIRYVYGRLYVYTMQFNLPVPMRSCSFCHMFIASLMEYLKCNRKT